VVLILSVAGPFLGVAEAAEVADLSIDDDFLAVVAIVQTTEVLEGDGVELPDLDTRVFHQLLELGVHLVPTGRVDHQPNLDPLASLGCQSLGDLIADVARPPDVGLHVHGFSGRRDVGEHPREVLITVLQQLDGIPILKTPLRQADDRREENLEFAWILDVEMGVGAALSGPEKDGQPGDGDDHGHQSNQGNPDGVRAAAALLNLPHQLRLQNISATTG
jgi:hypothetical protein